MGKMSCGCRVAPASGSVSLCALHEAAPVMLRTIREVVAAVEADIEQQAVQTGAKNWSPRRMELLNFLSIAKEVIETVEGK